MMAIRNVKAQLDDRMEGSDDERLVDARERLREAASNRKGADHGRGCWGVCWMAVLAN